MFQLNQKWSLSLVAIGIIMTLPGCEHSTQPSAQIRPGAAAPIETGTAVQPPSTVRPTAPVTFPTATAEPLPLAEKHAIQKVFSQYRDAVLGRDSIFEKVYPMLSKIYFAYLDDIADKALHMDSLSITKLHILDQKEVLLMRQTIPVQLIKKRDHRQIMRTYFKSQLVTITPTTMLASFEVSSPDYVNAYFQNRNKNVQQRFRKEANLWKLDLTPNTSEPLNPRQFGIPHDSIALRMLVGMQDGEGLKWHPLEGK